MILLEDLGYNGILFSVSQFQYDYQTYMQREKGIEDFMIREQIVKEKKLWNEIINKFKLKDIYFTYDYFSPFQKNGDGEPILYYFKCEYGKVAYPFMLRDIAGSNNLKGIIEMNKYFDISSVYGYGGPLFESHKPDDNIFNLKKEFYKFFSNYCKRTNIISQFDRFHPLIKNHVFFNDFSDLSQIRKTVHMDLINEKNIWDNIEPKCKNKIRKAIKNNVKIIIEDEFATLDTFKYIYNTTMDKNNASHYYYFNDNFFEDTANNLENNMVIANAYYEDNIIASSLIMNHNNYLHYHFSGTLKEYKYLQANNLLLYEVALWGSKNGYKYFHLGGGYESESDSLYKFKKSFSKIESNDFFVGKKIHNLEDYNKLTNIVKCKKTEESIFFPAYRK